MVKCDLCGREFKTTQGLRGHKTFFHQQAQFAADTGSVAPPATQELLRKLHLCPDCGASLHMHHFEHSFHLECVECGFYSVDYEMPKWKEPGRKLESPYLYEKRDFLADLE